jgi:hypothetical protein
MNDIKISFIENKQEAELLSTGSDHRQACSSEVGRIERSAFLSLLSKFLEKHGSVSNASWGTADFHFNPDPNPDLPCFVEIIFNAWPPGILREVTSFVQKYRLSTGHGFFIQIDRGAMLISVLNDGNVFVYVVGGIKNEALAREEIMVGIKT